MVLDRNESDGFCRKDGKAKKSRIGESKNRSRSPLLGLSADT